MPALFGWGDPGAAFSAVIQLGTLAAVLVYFAGEIRRLADSFLHDPVMVQVDRANAPAELVRHFAARAARELGIPEKPVSPEAVEVLQRWSWPGNIRELENEIRKAMALSDAEITADDLSLEIQGESARSEPVIAAAAPGAGPGLEGTLKEAVERTEKAAIEKALEEAGNNQTKAARRLGISRVWLRKKMERYGLLKAGTE